MRIVVDAHRCVGHARCEAVAGELYRTDPDDGCLHPIEAPVPPEHEAAALRGAKACPERAITLMGGPEGAQLVYPPQARA